MENFHNNHTTIELSRVYAVILSSAHFHLELHILDRYDLCDASCTISLSMAWRADIDIHRWSVLADASITSFSLVERHLETGQLRLEACEFPVHQVLNGDKGPDLLRL